MSDAAQNPEPKNYFKWYCEACKSHVGGNHVTKDHRHDFCGNKVVSVNNKSRWFETRYRSLIKAVTWRITGTIGTTIIFYALSGKWSMALWAGLIEFVTKIGLYWVHERIWDKVPAGKKEKI